MKYTPNSSPFLWTRIAFKCMVLVASSLLCGNAAIAKPRQPSPPWPEIGLIFHEAFDQPYNFPTNQVIDLSVWVESWTGYALNRKQGTIVTPWLVPMQGTNATYWVDPTRGALRFWYMPTWSSASTQQGNGPGNIARLLTLVSTNGSASAIWWSLVISEDGNAAYVVCQTETGPAACMVAPISFQAGKWHCLALGYTDTNSALFIDGQQVAIGGGMPSISVAAAPFTSLVIGSSLAGSEVAAGQIEEFSTFTGGRRILQMFGQPFGMGTIGDQSGYYLENAAIASLGPITEAEEEALRQKAIAARAARLAAQSADASSSLPSTTEGLFGGGNGPQLQSYDPSIGFGLLRPQVVQGTNLFLTLTNNDPSIGYDIYYTPAIATNMTWSILATGVVGQATFTVPTNGWQGFYRGAVGGDWDGDTIPNWKDANPTNAIIGTLSITIEQPGHGASIN